MSVNVCSLVGLYVSWCGWWKDVYGGGLVGVYVGGCGLVDVYRSGCGWKLYMWVWLDGYVFEKVWMGVYLSGCGLAGM